jgi:hypothetical protein
VGEIEEEEEEKRISEKIRDNGTSQYVSKSNAK